MAKRAMRRRAEERGRGRELRVSRDVARVLPAAVLAQQEAIVGDPDNICFACGQVISGSSAELVVFGEGGLASLVVLAHPGCMQSGIYPLPGLLDAVVGRFGAPQGLPMDTVLGVRAQAPRGLIFLEPRLAIAGPDGDPLREHARALGLEPVSGRVEDLRPPRTDRVTIERHPEGLCLRTPLGIDTVPAVPREFIGWLEAAEREAIVVLARGLGLRRSDPATIEEALELRPAWGGIARIAPDRDSAGGRRSPRSRWLRRRRSRR